MSPLAAMKWLWFAWAISWLIAALWSRRTEARPGATAEYLYRLVTLTGVALLFDLGHFPFLGQELWRSPLPLGWVLTGVTALGFSFCWWARIHLGTLWSSSVTRKADHRIIDTGPYGLVRHPIYTGIITASAAMAIEAGTPGGLLGLALVVLGFWIKARLEERFLRAELGAEAYDAYSRRTAMLFPRL
jgi:protein-S-isoprenylcysteine O-methyltransferase Ste14